MPLPEGGNLKWPPENMKDLYSQYAEHDAWYSGDPNKLADFYASVLYPPGSIGQDFFSDIYRNTIAPKRKFWGKQIQDERRSMLHVPMAGDIAGTSADLLFSESPRIKIPEAHSENAPSDAIATQDRLDYIINKADLINKLLEAAETCAALGGVYLKINWDSELAPFPMIGIAQPDTAVAEFTWGMLRAVTFWKVVGAEETRDRTIIYRLLERHEKGTIEYGLYKGSDDFLGIRIGLQARPETAQLQDIVQTGVDDILVRYIANMRPNKRHRGSPYGQSDFSGVEGLMDALDEVYSSWMRDIRLGQGRIMVPEYYLQRQTNGELSFDVDREVYTAFDIDPMSAQNIGITMNQFAIRTQEHMDTALELTNRIISTAGYSPQSFGLSIAGSAESGTALNIRERKSFITKAKKERYWKPALEDLLELLLMIDNIHFSSRVTLYRPVVEFQDSIQNDLSQVSATVDLLARATALSVDTKVRMIHPDWNDEQVMAEVDRIKEESGLSMPDPMQIGIS